MICTPKIRHFWGAYFLCRLETVFKIYNDNVSLSPVLDLYNREIISYCISLSPNLQQVREMLTGLIAKASGNSNCMDNGATESFFGRLKVEVFCGEQFARAEDFIHALNDYIYYYNNDRISLK